MLYVLHLVRTPKLSRSRRVGYRYVRTHFEQLQLYVHTDQEKFVSGVTGIRNV